MKLILQSLLFWLALSASAADIAKGEFGANKEGDETAAAPRAARAVKRTSYPFHGTLASVDVKSRTVILQGKQKNRIIAITPDTRIFRNNAKARLEDAVSGERVTGTLQKNDAGQEEAITVRFGGKPKSAVVSRPLRSGETRVP